MKTRVQTIKSKLKSNARFFVGGVLVGAGTAALIAHRMYHPSDKVAIQFPKGMVEMMQETGKGVAIHDESAGWFTINHHANKEN